MQYNTSACLHFYRPICSLYREGEGKQIYLSFNDSTAETFSSSFLHRLRDALNSQDINLVTAEHEVKKNAMSSRCFRSK